MSRMLKEAVSIVDSAPEMFFTVADDAAAKPGEEPGKRKGELLCTGYAIGNDGNRYREQFYLSDALDQNEVETLQALLAKLKRHVTR